jgi:hypothetical protein
MHSGISQNDHPLADKEFNRNSHFRASDDTYYFGTVDGLYAFARADLVFGEDVKPSSPPLISSRRKKVEETKKVHAKTQRRRIFRTEFTKFSEEERRRKKLDALNPIEA